MGWATGQAVIALILAAIVAALFILAALHLFMQVLGHPHHPE